jgi:membrane carboxypeptidase/penicillin-binding protein PbpC
MLEDRPARYGIYVPENFDMTFQGMVSARKALQLSLNVPAVELLSAVGPQRFLSRLRDTGAAIAMPKEGGAPGLAVGLGGSASRLQDLTRLYVGLARGGEMLPLNAAAPSSRATAGSGIDAGSSIPGLRSASPDDGAEFSKEPGSPASSTRSRPGMSPTRCSAHRRR